MPDRLDQFSEFDALQAGAVPELLRHRADFPILQRLVHGRPLVYLDNAATSQKPWPVIDAEDRYYAEHNANVHRGIHRLSQEATDAFEAARDKVRAFIGAAAREEIIFTRGTTEAINLVAHSFGQRLGAGDEIVVSTMEHHSNIVPWQLLCARSGAVLRVAPIDERGQLVLGEYERLLGPRTRLVAIGHMSNALGSINPLPEVIRLAHRVAAVVLVDGAQAVPHLAVDVSRLDCDFYAFSGHKLYGPTGIGVLYGRRALLDEMPPWQGGGDMIRQVSFAASSWNELPYKFEAGTPHIAGAIGLGYAIDYLQGIGLPAIAAHEAALLEHAVQRAAAFPGLRQIGTAEARGPILSFTLAGIHPHDIGTILDAQGIAIRTGHHCAMPVMERYAVPATARASFALYNTRSEIDALFAALEKVQELMT